jgi:hypothetical protein
MANLTVEQSQALWDNAFKKTREFVNGVYLTTRVHSKLDGFEYYIDSNRQSLAITETSTSAEIETAVVTHFQTQEYLGADPIGKSVPFN